MRAAVALSFDSDHETIWLRDAQTSPGRLSQGEYGARAAVPRILRLLDRRGIPASFFIPAVCALLRPAEVRGYVQAGHEVALHGWIHERNSELPAATERALTLRAAETLTRVAGTPPAGIRTPSWDFSHATLDIITELGLSYDSSLMADDDPYEIEAAGSPGSWRSRCSGSGMTRPTFRLTQPARSPRPGTSARCGATSSTRPTPAAPCSS